MPVKIKEQPNNIDVFYDSQLRNYVDSWMQRCFQIIPLHNMNTNLMEWRCFSCSSSILVKYDSKNHKDFYCAKCKKDHLALPRPHALLLRHMWRFNLKVQNQIINHTYNLDELMEAKTES